ncbi:dihydrodipicolinate reductase [Streptomyces sp. PSKA54]|uniref:Dihydrodipicolinate reductase n=1 Tax=Streptomyces himalayensis subsp. aureolus TaxID=2758039 RepID=A0A7W2D2Y1_9ACTN|nr:dihydrodipicolinate reductase [Streptomyces himalayensis]MBA4863500.1 dihydrodipicolinate reductase [Streptomyces himalayensis subsp. aureolus]
MRSQGASAAGRPYRVVQWATGNIGSRALRATIQHPQLELAGVYVHTPAKAGRDAGDLCGLPPVGVAATDDIEEILALGADCVLYAPRELDVDVLCRLLASGIDVVTTRTDFHHRDRLDPALREPVEAACRKGASSLHSTGSSPGFITEAVPLVLSSIQRRLDSLLIEEYADLSRRDSPALLFEVMAFGKPPAAFDAGRVEHLGASFGPSLRLVADTLGIRLDGIEATGEVARARSRIHIAAGTIEPGTVAAQRITVAGVRDGRPVLRFRANWYCGTDLDRDWELRSTGWHVTLEGDAPLDIDIRFPVPLDRLAAVSPSYTANRAVNAVPYVCQAPPGIRTTADLPQIVAALG